MRQNLFVGREREQRLYQEFLAADMPWVLIITGIGGNGKSTLLHRLDAHTPPHIPTVALDFAEQELRTNPLHILEELAKKLHPYCEESLPTFQRELHSGRDLASTQGQRAVKTIQDSDSWKLKQDLSLAQREAVQVQVQDLVTQVSYPQIQELATEAFYHQLDTYKPDRLVLLLDTCEWLSEPEGREVGQWLWNELLPTIHSNLQRRGRQCHVVITSRVYPNLQAINEQERLHITLPMLDSAAVAFYLTALGMQDKELQQRVYEITHGLPLCVAIIGSLWEEQGEKPLTIDDLPQLQEEFTQRALIDFIQERLDKRLRSPYRELTRYGVLLRSFNLPLLRAVFPELLPEAEALERFEQLIRYPYIEFQGHHRYAFQELLREVQTEDIREQEPEQWRLYHQRAIDYYRQMAASEAVPLSPELYYHAIALDEKAGMEEWREALQAALRNDTRENVNALLQVPRDTTLRLTTAAQAFYAYEQGRYHYYKARWQDTLFHYEEALKLFRQVRDRLGEATVLQAIGDIQLYCTEQGDLLWNCHPEEVLQNYQSALAYFQEVNDLQSMANVLQSMGKVYDYRKELDAALLHYEQALRAYQKLGEPEGEARIRGWLGEANIRSLIGKIQETRGEPEEALESYRQSLALFRQAGDQAGVKSILQAIDAVRNSSATMPRSPKFPEMTGALTPIKPPDPASVPRDTDPVVPSVAGLPPALTFTPGRPPSRRWRASRLLLILMTLVLVLGTSLIYLVAQFSRPHPPNPSSATATARSTTATAAVNPCVAVTPSLPAGIGSVQAGCGEGLIGISDGRVAFDVAPDRVDRDLKIAAAAATQPAQAKDLWGQAARLDTSDAEPLIYLEDQNVLASGKPYITLIIGTTLGGNGDFNGGGRDILQGAYLAQKEHNKVCILADSDCAPVRLLIANISSNPAYAASVTQQIVQVAAKDHTVIGVMGWPLSSATIEAIDILKNARIPLVSATASSDLLTQKQSPYFFRVAPPDSQQGKVGAVYAINTLHAHTAAIFVDPTDPYSNTLAAAFQKQFASLGNQVVDTEHYTIGNRQTLPGSLQSALQKAPDLIYFAGYARDVSQLLVSLTTSNNAAAAHVQILGGDALYVMGDYTNPARSGFNRLHFTAFAHSQEWAKLQLPSPSFFNAYASNFDPRNTHGPEDYGYRLADGDVILSYDATGTMLVAYHNASHLSGNIIITPGALRDSLGQINAASPIQGISGQIAFGTDGNPLNKPVVILSFDNNNNVRLEAIEPAQCFVAIPDCG